MEIEKPEATPPPFEVNAPKSGPVEIRIHAAAEPNPDFRAALIKALGRNARSLTVTEPIRRQSRVVPGFVVDDEDEVIRHGYKRLFVMASVNAAARLELTKSVFSAVVRKQNAVGIRRSPVSCAVYRAGSTPDALECVVRKTALVLPANFAREFADLANSESAASIEAPGPLQWPRLGNDAANFPGRKDLLVIITGDPVH